jgi:murein DD-endopeptidase MepM/ murein hydrolase activator NlpD
MRNIRIKTIIAASLTAVMIMTSILTISATTSTQLRRDRQEILNSLAESKRNLQSTNAQRNAELVLVEEYDKQLALVTAQLDEITDLYDSTALQLERAQSELEEIERQVEIRREQFRIRIRFMYENGRTGYAQVLLNAVSIQDFLSRSEYIRTIMDSDAELINTLIDLQDRYDSMVVEIEDRKEILERLLYEIEDNKGIIEEIIDQKTMLILQLEADAEVAQSVIDMMNQSSLEIERKIRAAEALEAEARREKERLAALTATTTILATRDVGSVTFSWPLSRTHRVTSQFGSRVSPISGRREHHSGIDIGAPRNTNIMAAADGKVISSGWMRGYGETIVIDHGGGYSSMYAHCSTRLVRVGQEVSRGEVIGRVGTTGWTTGPHLHFEVRVNGTPVNPINYLPR